MTWTLGALRRELGGQLSSACDEAAIVQKASSIESTDSAGSIGLLIDPRYVESAREFAGVAVLTDRDYGLARTWLHPEAARAFDGVIDRVLPPRIAFGVHPRAVVSPRAALASGVSVEACAVVGDLVELGENVVIEAGAVVGPSVSIGANTRIGANAVILAGVVIGERVEIGPATVIGSSGFGYRAPGQGETGLQRRRHVGGVSIEDDVHIGASVCIDAGTLEPTVVERGVRIDNLVHLAHNTRVGARTVILAQTGVAGSSVIEHDCALAGQVGVAGHLRVGAGSQAAAQSGIGHNLAAGSVVGGSPAFDIGTWKRSTIAMKTLSEERKRLRALEREVATLRESLAQLRAVGGMS